MVKASAGQARQCGENFVFGHTEHCSRSPADVHVHDGDDPDGIAEPLRGGTAHDPAIAITLHREDGRSTVSSERPDDPRKKDRERAKGSPAALRVQLAGHLPPGHERRGEAPPLVRERVNATALTRRAAAAVLAR